MGPQGDTRCKVVVRRLPPSLQVIVSVMHCELLLLLAGLWRLVPLEGPKPRRHFPVPLTPLQEDAFREALGEWIARSDWFCYVAGKARCGPLAAGGQP